MALASSPTGARATAALAGPAGTLAANNYWQAASELLLGASQTSGSLPKPAGAIAGDTLVVFYAADDNSAGFTTSLAAAGFLQQGVDQTIAAPDGQRVAFWTKEVLGTEPASWTLTRDLGGNTFSHSVSCLLYRGLDNAALIDAAISFAQNTAANPSPVSLQGNAISTVSNGAVVLYVVAVDNTVTNSVTYQAPPTYDARAEADQGTFTSVFATDKVQVVPGFTGVPVGRATLPSGNAGYIAASIAFKVAAGGAINVNASDAVAANDSASDALVAAASANDAVTAADAASSASASNVAASDAVAAADSSTSAAASNASAADAVSAADTAGAQIVAPANASDAAVASDAATAQAVLPAAASDAIATADTSTAQAVAARSASDAVAAADASSAQLAATVAAIDAVAAADLATQSGGNALQAVDAISAADSASAQLVAVLVALDALAVTDAATGLRSITVSASDAVALADQAGAGLVALLQATDAVLAIDSAAHTGVLNVVASDLLALIDAATVDGGDSYEADSRARIGAATLQGQQKRVGGVTVAVGAERIGTTPLRRTRRIGKGSL